MNIGVFSSGGDSPGMNAALRSVVRSSIEKGFKVYGVLNGYNGLIGNQFIDLDYRSVANIVHQGGTVLKTSRSKDFLIKENRELAYRNLKAKNITRLIGLGGDGTITGLKVFNEEHSDIQTIGIPCTIDNDYFYSDDCIGYDTATNTAVEAMDRVRDTANSHERTFIIEVMGRKSSSLAFDVGVAGGAEFVLDINQTDALEECIEVVSQSIKKGKRASLIVVLESSNPNVSSAAHYVKEKLEARLSVDARAVVLGHLQRGGRPSSHDRLLASRMGFCAANMKFGDSGAVVKNSGLVKFISFKNQKIKRAVDESDEENKTLIKTLSL